MVHGWMQRELLVGIHMGTATQGILIALLAWAVWMPALRLLLYWPRCLRRFIPCWIRDLCYSCWVIFKLDQFHELIHWLAPV